MDVIASPALPRDFGQHDRAEKYFFKGYIRVAIVVFFVCFCFLVHRISLSVRQLKAGDTSANEQSQVGGHKE